MTLGWFHLETVPAEGEVVVLDDREARHAVSARRMRPGEPLVVFDGRGTRGDAELVSISDRQVSVKIKQRVSEATTGRRVHLAAALPKGDRQGVLLGMATQLGVASFRPLVCQHNVAQPSEGFFTRAQRICLEACKQSRRADLPEILEPCPPADAAKAGRIDGMSVFIAHPGGPPLGEVASAVEALVLIGPEGGFTDEEVAAAVSQGARPVSLGPTVLRVETAAVAALARLRL